MCYVYIFTKSFLQGLIKHLIKWNFRSLFNQQNTLNQLFRDHWHSSIDCSRIYFIHYYEAGMNHGCGEKKRINYPLVFNAMKIRFANVYYKLYELLSQILRQDQALVKKMPADSVQGKMSLTAETFKTLYIVFFNNNYCICSIRSK